MSTDVFFRHIGTKWRSAPLYPRPEHDTIIEPFAGAAGYSVRHHRRKVILVERDPEICAVWRYLIKASAREILALPDLADDGAVADLKVSDEVRHLIRRNVAKASGPSNRFTAWRVGTEHTLWGPVFRARLAAQVERIRHWKVIEGDYTLAPDVRATWFIDPPYSAPRLDALYAHRASALDFAALGAWCRSRRGQVIVCEGPGANWLPFQKFRVVRRAPRKAGETVQVMEMIWTNNDETQKEAPEQEQASQRPIRRASAAR